jgi:hypothetical protein
MSALSATSSGTGGQAAWATNSGTLTTSDGFKCSWTTSRKYAALIVGMGPTASGTDATGTSAPVMAWGATPPLSPSVGATGSSGTSWASGASQAGAGGGGATATPASAWASGASSSGAPVVYATASGASGVAQGWAQAGQGSAGSGGSVDVTAIPASAFATGWGSPVTATATSPAAVVVTTMPGVDSPSGRHYHRTTYVIPVRKTGADGDNPYKGKIVRRRGWN